jgi:hypothetical protein
MEHFGNGFVAVLLKDYQPLAGFRLRGFMSRPVRDEMLVENDETNYPRPVGMQCW